MTKKTESLLTFTKAVIKQVEECVSNDMDDAINDAVLCDSDDFSGEFIVARLLDEADNCRRHGA